MNVLYVMKVWKEIVKIRYTRRLVLIFFMQNVWRLGWGVSWSAPCVGPSCRLSIIFLDLISLRNLSGFFSCIIFKLFMDVDCFSSYCSRNRYLLIKRLKYIFLNWNVEKSREKLLMCWFSWEEVEKKKVEFFQKKFISKKFFQKKSEKFFQKEKNSLINIKKFELIFSWDSNIFFNKIYQNT